MTNRIRQIRLDRNWTQAELASAAGISRAAVSAIESERLAPSVDTALALGRIFGCPVESLFGADEDKDAAPQWAWAPTTPECRFWLAEVNGRTLAYPVETTAAGMLEHDGVFSEGRFNIASRHDPRETLTIACCDPASSLLALEISRRTNIRTIIFPRSSRRSLGLLGQGVVMAAGSHLSTDAKPGNNEKAVREELGAGFRLLRLARWEEGMAVAPTAQCQSIRQVFKSDLRIVGREAGSGARQCLDEIMGRRKAPGLIASSHHGVVEAIRSGWADTGPCLRMAAEDGGLSFLSVRREIFEFCFPSANDSDPRIRALVAAVRSAACRRLYNELPGYDSSEGGELRSVV